MSSMVRAGDSGWGYRRVAAVVALAGTVGLAMYYGFRKLRARSNGSKVAEKRKEGEVCMEW